MSKSKLEYIWLDGYQPTQSLRSKTKVVTNFSGRVEDAPMWFFNYSKAVMAFQPWVHGAQANAVDLALQDPEAMWIGAESPRADLK